MKIAIRLTEKPWNQYQSITLTRRRTNKKHDLSRNFAKTVECYVDGCRTADVYYSEVRGYVGRTKGFAGVLKSCLEDYKRGGD